MLKLDFVYNTEIGGDTRLAVVKLPDKLNELSKIVSLDDAGKKNYNNIKNRHYKIQWLTVRLLLNNMTGEKKYITYDKFGKPHITDKSYNISISHTDSYVAVLLSRNKDAGVDIEIRNDKICRIIHKFLNKKELSYVEETNKQTKYLLYWNAKEALYKLYGKKGLIFKENILLSSFVLKNQGNFDARIKTDFYNESFIVNYKIFKDFTLAWCVK